ncbi:hypothetical protein CKAH01_04593 [Colletotrichum kahawae]|uniref:Uncharacterized protein n=1 Tax=Colletotrichum kahawae TaxID=34407 RepID=A0AAE0D8X1_COLKA|nr:hypothetical protein CKAH01_04593 [Colletotrichum kahawae]
MKEFIEPLTATDRERRLLRVCGDYGRASLGASGCLPSRRPRVRDFRLYSQNSIWDASSCPGNYHHLEIGGEGGPSRLDWTELKFPKVSIVPFGLLPDPNAWRAPSIIQNPKGRSSHTNLRTPESRRNVFLGFAKRAPLSSVNASGWLIASIRHEMPRRAVSTLMDFAVKLV